MTSRKKEILSYFEPDRRDLGTSEIGALPFDVSGVTYRLPGMVSFDKRHQLESTRRTLESMVAGGLLERVIVYESRQVRCDGETNATVVHYGLPGQCANQLLQAINTSLLCIVLTFCHRYEPT